MSFIGHDQVPAPKLKEVKLSSEEMKEAYYQTLHVSCTCGSTQTLRFKIFPLAKCYSTCLWPQLLGMIRQEVI